MRITPSSSLVTSSVLFVTILSLLFLTKNSTNKPDKDHSLFNSPHKKTLLQALSMHNVLLEEIDQSCKNDGWKCVTEKSTLSSDGKQITCKNATGYFMFNTVKLFCPKAILDRNTQQLTLLAGKHSSMHKPVKLTHSYFTLTASQGIIDLKKKNAMFLGNVTSTFKMTSATSHGRQQMRSSSPA